MSAPSIARVPAGHGSSSGRFASNSHAETDLTLDGAPVSAPGAAVPEQITHRDPRVVAIIGLAQDQLAGAEGDLYPVFRTYAAGLSDTEADLHWNRLLTATRRYEMFADPETGEDAAEDALENGDPDLLGERSLSDYEKINEADRPGESEYVGFDFPRAAEDLTGDWETAVDQAAIDTVRLTGAREGPYQAA